MNFMTEQGYKLPEGLRDVTLAQMCRLQFGQEVLNGIFQDAFAELLR